VTLIEQERSTFKNSVANIEPGETVLASRVRIASAAIGCDLFSAHPVGRRAALHELLAAVEIHCFDEPRARREQHDRCSRC
jgi:hypothetical protein